MKVLFQTHGLINDEYKEFFRSNLPDDVELVFPKDNDKETLLDLASDCHVFVGYSVVPKFMEKAEKLKHIQVPWTGFNRMDTDLLSKYPDVTVSNSHSNSLAIAEHAVALLFSAAKQISYRDKYMRKGDWSPRYSDKNESFWITDKTLGILGYGAIGKKIAAMLKPGFSLQVLAVKRHKPDKQEIERDISDYIGGSEDLGHVLERSDFVIVALPLTDETKGLIGKSELSSMKENSIIVNVGRGEIIEEEALYEALKNKNIGAAGIDTWYNYPQTRDIEDMEETRQNFPFEELDNIVLSPHSAFKIRNRTKVFATDILENINRIYDNKEPINQVNLDLGY